MMAARETLLPENRYVLQFHRVRLNNFPFVLALLALAAPRGFAAEPAASPAGPSLVERGKYVALLGDCMACHTAKGGQPYAGGAALQSAFGNLYGPNITPDRDTGIGTWTKSDFERALRLGVAKDGSYIYPAMPYDAYTKMTAADMNALWAYMRTVPPVHNTPPKNTLPFPLTIREGLAVWQSVYFTPGPFKPEPHKSAQWNRGAYLVDALEHCSECHTPRNVAQGLEQQHALAGAQISGWYAPDISNDRDSKINEWSTDALAKFLKTGVMGNVKVVGPMQETMHDSLRHLEDSDLRAMAVYLKDQPTVAQPVTADKVKLPAERLANGRRVYEDACSACHQTNGKGIAGAVPALAGNDSVTAGEPYNIIMSMLEGFPPQGTWGAMGSFANSLSDDQIADVANYVRTAWGNDAAPNATPWSVSTWRKNATSVQNQPHALLCPSLATDVVKPALSDAPAALKQAASDRATMTKLINDYRTARPKTSPAEVVEALSTAYCRAVAADHVSEARMSAQIADFAQRIAVALNDRQPTG
jgi:mono/diheme cytochrome c family protein